MPSQGTFVYVSNAESLEIGEFELNRDDGTLASLGTMAIPGFLTPSQHSMPLATTPDRRNLYVALRAEPYTVASFSVDPLNGGLTYLASAPVPASMCYIVTDREGRFLLCASPGRNPSDYGLISISPIGPHGFIQPVQQVIPVEGRLHGLLTDPTNRYVLATDVGRNVLLRQSFDSTTGTIIAGTASTTAFPPKARPRHMTFHPTNRFLYVLNESGGSISVFAFDSASGSLSSRGEANMREQNDSRQPRSADLHILPNGKFLYASERNSNTIAAFAVDAESGALSLIGNFPTETEPRGFNIDPFGRFLLAVGLNSHRLTVHKIDQTSGELSTLQSYSMGRGPNWIEMLNLP